MDIQDSTDTIHSLTMDSHICSDYLVFKVWSHGEKTTAVVLMAIGDDETYCNTISICRNNNMMVDGRWSIGQAWGSGGGQDFAVLVLAGSDRWIRKYGNVLPTRVAVLFITVVLRMCEEFLINCTFVVYRQSVVGTPRENSTIQVLGNYYSVLDTAIRCQE